jgi:hypothetical protein
VSSPILEGGGDLSPSREIINVTIFFQATDQSWLCSLGQDSAVRPPSPCTSWPTQGTTLVAASGLAWALSGDLGLEATTALPPLGTPMSSAPGACESRGPVGCKLPASLGPHRCPEPCSGLGDRSITQGHPAGLSPPHSSPSFLRSLGTSARHQGDAGRCGKERGDRLAHGWGRSGDRRDLRLPNSPPTPRCPHLVPSSPSCTAVLLLLPGTLMVSRFLRGRLGRLLQAGCPASSCVHHPSGPGQTELAQSSLQGRGCPGARGGNRTQEERKCVIGWEGRAGGKCKTPQEMRLKKNAKGFREGRGGGATTRWPCGQGEGDTEVTKEAWHLPLMKPGPPWTVSSESLGGPGVAFRGRLQGGSRGRGRSFWWHRPWRNSRHCHSRRRGSHKGRKPPPLRVPLILPPRVFWKLPGVHLVVSTLPGPLGCDTPQGHCVPEQRPIGPPVRP